MIRNEQGHESQGMLQAREPKERADLRYVGEELARNEVFAQRGDTISPALTGLAAAAGYDHLPVRRRPRIDLLVLGNELLLDGPARDGRVHDALGPQLPAWVEWLGGEIATQALVPDVLGDLCEVIAASDADVVVTIGGSSHGRRDHVRSTIEELGGSLVIDQVAVKPGHPMLLASLPKGAWFVGLPGNLVPLTRQS